MNIDVMFWCVYSYWYFVSCIISVIHVVCESIWIGVRLKFILLLFIENTQGDVLPKKIHIMFQTVVSSVKIKAVKSKCMGVNELPVFKFM